MGEAFSHVNFYKNAGVYMAEVYSQSVGAVRIIKKCKKCYSFFGTFSSFRVFCSPACENIYTKTRERLKTEAQERQLHYVESRKKKLLLKTLRKDKKEAKRSKRQLKRQRRMERKKSAIQKPKTISFYETREWMELRYKVFKRDGRVCSCCRTTFGEMHVDHIKPRSRFPDLELDITNLQVLCRACNLGKSNKDSTDWRHVPAPPSGSLQAPPERPNDLSEKNIN